MTTTDQAIKLIVAPQTIRSNRMAPLPRRDRTGILRGRMGTATMEAMTMGMENMVPRRPMAPAAIRGLNVQGQLVARRGAIKVSGDMEAVSVAGMAGERAPIRAPTVVKGMAVEPVAVERATVRRAARKRAISASRAEAMRDQGLTSPAGGVGTTLR
jgi:hypothetical protein